LKNYVSIERAVGQIADSYFAQPTVDVANAAVGTKSRLQTVDPVSARD
jgi:hypothetical protein